MSKPVPLDDLADAIAEHPPGYLVTVGADGHVKAVTVEPRVEDGVVVVDGPGKGSTANIADRPAVTLILPPAQPRGFTLLVDGTAEVVDGPDGRALITPTTAVLHRPARHADGGPTGGTTGGTDCGHDCTPV